MMSDCWMFSWSIRFSWNLPFSNTMIGVPSTMRPNRGECTFSQPTSRCIRPKVTTTLTPAVIECSSLSTLVRVVPATRNSTTRSSGASWLEVRRPRKRSANNRIQ